MFRKKRKLNNIFISSQGLCSKCGRRNTDGIGTYFCNCLQIKIQDKYENIKCVIKDYSKIPITDPSLLLDNPIK